MSDQSNSGGGTGGTYSGLPVAGYKPQAADRVAIVNRNKQLEEEVLRQLDAMKRDPAIDGRWLQAGRTELEKAFMCINRAVFQPGRVKLEGDDAHP